MENLKLLSISLRLYYFPMVPQFSGGNFNDSFRDTYPYYRRQYNHDHIFFFHFDYLSYTFLLKCFHYKRLHVLLGIFCFLHINRWNKAPIPCILSKNFLFLEIFIFSFIYISFLRKKYAVQPRLASEYDLKLMLILLHTFKWDYRFYIIT